MITKSQDVNLVRPAAVCLLSMIFTGCGWQTYEERHNESRNYYAYLSRGEEVLAESPDELMSNYMKLRVARRFVPDLKGDKSPKQPGIARRNALSGLLGSWKAEVIDEKSGESRSGPSRMYVFGNYQRFVERNEGVNTEPMTFQVQLVEEFCDALGVGDPGEWKYEPLPSQSRGGYLESKHFSLVTLKARGSEYRMYIYPAPRIASEDSEDEVPEDEHLQFVFVFVLPRKSDSIQNLVTLEDGIRYSLEWLSITAGIPEPDKGDGTSSSGAGTDF